jgi:ERCC4-type nuclease
MSLVKFTIDNRETIKDDLKKIIPDAQCSNLEIGDYQYSVDNSLFLIIERKTISDYAASIKDHRNREQKKRLLGNKGNAFVLFLVEGDLTSNNSSFRYNKVDKNTIISSIVNTITRDNINVFHTSNKTETIFFLKSIYKKLSKQGLTFLNKKTTHSEDLVTTCIQQNKSNNIDPKICFQMILNCIPKVSNTISKRIISNYDNINQFIKVVENIDKCNRVKELVKLKSKDVNTKERNISKTAIENIIHYIGID